MKTKTILLAMFAMGVLFTSCKKDEEVSPSNNVTTVSKTISGYSELNVSGPFKVYVTFSDAEENIKIEANSNLQQHITCEKIGNELHIYVDNNVTIDGNAVLNVYISTQQINTFSADGASTILLQNELNTNKVTIDLNGACSFSGTMHVSELNADLKGASNLTIEGSSGSIDLNAIGASNLQDYGFETNNFTCDLDGACNVYLTIQQSLNVKASGGSNVYYKGNGTVSNQDLTGGSTIQKMN